MIDPRDFARRALMLAGALACSGTLAQAPAPEAGSSAADRAQKESERTLYWIRVLAEKPASKTPQAKPAAAPPAHPTVAATPAIPAAPAPAATPAPVKAAAVAVASPRPAAAPLPAPAAPLPAAAAPLPAAAAPPAATPVAGGPAANAATSQATLAVTAVTPAAAAGLAAPALTPAAPADVAEAPEDDTPDPGLVLTRSVDPQFPMNTMRRLRKGQVEVRFEVSPEGQVDVVSVVRSTNPSLNDAALDAVRQWRFKPTPRGHTALVDVGFDLDR